MNSIDDISKHNPIDLLKLAKKLRKQEDTRQAAIHLLVETAMSISRSINALPLKERTSQPSLLSEWIPEIIMDIEDVLEALSYYVKKNGCKKKIPLSLKRGLAKVLENNGMLEISQYSCSSKDCLISLCEALKILHPKDLQLSSIIYL